MPLALVSNLALALKDDWSNIVTSLMFIISVNNKLIVNNNTFVLMHLLVNKTELFMAVDN